MTAAFLSLFGAVVAFSAFSAFSGLSTLGLSADEGFRTGEGFCVEDEVGVGSGFGIEVAEAGCELILLSDLIASLVVNIRVSRFVIEGFSGAPGASCFCGSEGGAA